MEREKAGGCWFVMEVVVEVESSSVGLRDAGGLIPASQSLAERATEFMHMAVSQLGNIADRETSTWCECGIR